MSVWDNIAHLESLEITREISRSKRQNKFMTFDCYNCHGTDDTAFCQRGHHLGLARDGSISLLGILRGRTSRQCLMCIDRNV